MRRLFVLLTFLACAYVSQAQTVVQMEKKGGVYYVPCTVNGLKLSFIFDTGASDVSISLSEALFMLKNGYLSEDDLLGTEYYRIANGDVAEGTKINLRSIVIGGKELRNVKASIVHSATAPLLLGQSVLERFGNVSVNYSNQTLVLGGGAVAAHPQPSRPSTVSTPSTAIGQVYGGGVVFHIGKDGRGLIVALEDQGKADWEKAKQLCASYRGGGFSDWYLPSISELETLYRNRQKVNDALKTIGRNEIVGSYYWSGTKDDADFALAYTFGHGHVTSASKNTSFYVAVVRAF